MLIATGAGVSSGMQGRACLGPGFAGVMVAVMHSLRILDLHHRLKC